MKPTVHILVTGRAREALPNCRLVFRTIRTGFPTADIVVRDNDSIPEFVEELRQLTESVGGRYYHQRRGEHGEFIAEVVAAADGPIVFVDTDMIFWASCEDLAFPPGALYAGRLLDAMDECGARMAARIHPSFFWVPDPPALRAAIAGLPAQRLGYLRPFQGYTVADENDRLLCFDTCASLYSFLPERAYAFTATELDRYDHLFCGTLLDTLDAMGMTPEAKALIRRSSAAAHTAPETLRGLWKKQERFQGGHAENAVSWQYLSGSLATPEGRRFGVSVAVFPETGKAHIGVLDVATGRHVSQVAPANPDRLCYDTGVVGLGLSVVTGEFTDHGLHARPGGETHHWSAPFARAEGTLMVGGELYAVGGQVWIDQELGHISPKAGWRWAAITLDSGERAMAYDFGSEGRWTRWHADGSVSSGELGRVYALADGHFEVRTGNEAWELVPCAPDQIIYGGAMTYTEALCDVIRGQQRIGHAYLEILPDGWGRPQLPPQGVMHGRWAAGNPDAAVLIGMLGRASQTADDFVDGEIPETERSAAMVSLIDTLLFGVSANPFYIEHCATIGPFLKRALHFWHSSNVWATAPKLETRMFSYVHRESMMDVVWWIAFLAGGDAHAQSVAMDIHRYFHGEGGVESFAEWDRERKVRSN